MANKSGVTQFEFLRRRLDNSRLSKIEQAKVVVRFSQSTTELTKLLMEMLAVIRNMEQLGMKMEGAREAAGYVVDKLNEEFALVFGVSLFDPMDETPDAPEYDPSASAAE